MKICWMGFGPGMSEISGGVSQFDPEMLFYIIGKGGAFDRNNPNSGVKNTKVFTTKEELFADLQEFDVIIYDTYVFSVGDRPDIISFLTGSGCVTQWEEWKALKAVKILCDTESVSGKKWHQAHLQFFDKIFTTNPAIPGFYTCYGINPAFYNNTGSNDEIKVLYTGSNLNRCYRKELADFIRGDPKNVIADWLPDENRWLDLLNKSKMYLSTFSCANGEKFPMHTKNKEYKSLLCGALPLTEELIDADAFLIPGKERITFKDFKDLQDKIDYFDTHEDERRAIVEAGKKKVLEELTNEKMWQRAFKHFGLI